MKNKISAKIIADSLAPNGSRCTTFILQFPRIVLAEFNTHRMISKNSASSRAIPFEKMLEMVKTDPFIPLKWMKNHKGMQGNDYFDEEESSKLTAEWLTARDVVAGKAAWLNHLGVSKQITNRLLEPFLWHTVIATATDWENFFSLRAHSAAEIHIAELAYCMLHEYNESKPVQLRARDWHIPFGDRIDLDRLLKLEGISSANDIEISKLKISTARCARISYLNFEGKDDYEADIKLFNQLSTSGHWSPFEHCAMANHSFENNYIGNLKGFTQWRKTFNNENATDARVNK